MKNKNKYIPYEYLSFLLLIGLATIPAFSDSNYIFLSYLLCGIGGYSLGVIVADFVKKQK